MHIYVFFIRELCIIVCGSLHAQDACKENEHLLVMHAIEAKDNNSDI